MDSNDVIILVGESRIGVSDTGIPMHTEERYECLARLVSIGGKEFYQAQTSGVKPELKFILSDFEDYRGESFLEHEGMRYKVLRTYRTGRELEITVYGGVRVERS